MSKTQHHGDALDDILARKETDYIRRHPQSKKHHELAVSSMPGGNTRSVLFNKPFPITMERGIGNKLVDCDGNKYVNSDYTNSSFFTCSGLFVFHLRSLFDFLSGHLIMLHYFSGSWEV